MRRFRKTFIAEAMQLAPLSIDAIEEWVGGDVGRCSEHGSCWMIATLEGTMHASVNYWIVKGVEGEFHPVRPDIFAKTYEEVFD